MRKISIILLLICFLFTGCNGDIYTDEAPEEDDGIRNIVLNGDFTAFTDSVDSLNWGGSNALIVSDAKNGKGVKMTGSSYIFYGTLSTFGSSGFTASADVSLSAQDIADKVELLVEFDDKDGNVCKSGEECALFSAKAAAETGWQKVTFHIEGDNVGKYSPYRIVIKVVSQADDSSYVLVDNVKLSVDDKTAFNMLPNGSFLAPVDGKWKTITLKPEGDEWNDSTVVDVDGKKAVSLSYGKYEFLTSNSWVANGYLCPRYNTKENGELSFQAKGKGNITVYVERKNSDDDVLNMNPVSLTVTDTWATYKVQIPKEEREYNETTLKIVLDENGTGTLYVTDVSLHYTEGK